MQFKAIKARSNWRETASELGYLCTVLDHPPYWIEALPEPFYVEFERKEIEQLIEPSTKAIIDIAHQTVDEVVAGKRSKEFFDRMKTPVRCREAIKASWKNEDVSLWGRLDFSYSDGQLKLLELNFDGAISIYEASVFQRIWLDQLMESGALPQDLAQSNSIHDQLIETFAKIVPEGTKVHFTSLGRNPEEDDTIKYLQSCAVLAGKETVHLGVKSLGYDKEGNLVDLEGQPIKYLVKLYPWELLFREDGKIAEDSGKSVLLPLVEQSKVHFIEPAWKSLLSNKAILSVMAELFPDCPYLLKAAVEGSPEANQLKQKPYAKKPLFGMQGVSVSLVYPDDPERSFSVPGGYGREGFLIQELHPLPTYNDYHVLVGSWVVDNRPAGIGIRADLSPITTGHHCLFVPHTVKM